MSLSVDVTLLSGRTATVQVARDGTVNDLRRSAQEELDTPIANIVTSPGECLPGPALLSTVGIGHGTQVFATARTTLVASCYSGFLRAGSTWNLAFSNLADAFVAFRPNSSATAWGDAGYGGDCEVVREQLYDVQEDATTYGAFAVLRRDGTVVTWGSPEIGGDCTSCKAELKKIRALRASRGAFAAIREDGAVVTWGDPFRGADISRVQNRLTGVREVRAAARSFAALREDGTVVTWGDAKHGGNSVDVQHRLEQVLDITASAGAFAARRHDGGVVTWGEAKFSGDSSAVKERLLQVRKICATPHAFTAIKEDGTVVTWGEPEYGGDCASVQDQLKDVCEVCATAGAFAGLRADGTVVTWGNSAFGGESAAVQELLVQVQTLTASARAIAARRADGRVVTWGCAESGGDSREVQDELVQVEDVFANQMAFAALKADGSVVTWGAQGAGGDSSSVRAELYSVQMLGSIAGMGAFAAVRSDGAIVTWGDANHGGQFSPGCRHHQPGSHYLSLSDDLAFSLRKRGDGESAAGSLTTVVTTGSDEVAGEQADQALAEVEAKFAEELGSLGEAGAEARLHDRLQLLLKAVLHRERVVEEPTCTNQALRLMVPSQYNIWCLAEERLQVERDTAKAAESDLQELEDSSRKVVKDCRALQARVHELEHHETQIALAMAHDDGISIDEAFQQVGVGYGSCLLLFITGMLFCADAAELGFIAYAIQPLEHRWGLHASEVVFLEQAVLSGQILGPLFWGRLADRHGRRPAILACAGVVLVCGLLTAAAQNYWQLVIVQAGVGFGVSGVFLCMDILCELLPKEGCGPFCNALQFFWPFGGMFLLFAAWATLDFFGWRGLTVCAAIPISAAFVLAIGFLPESPHWLLEQGRNAEARAALEYLAALNGVKVSFGKLADAEQTPRSEHRDQAEAGRASWTGHLGKLCSLTAVWFLMDAVYMSSLLLGPVVFVKPVADDAEPGEQTPALDFLPLSLSSGSELVSVILGLLLLDRLGRRKFQFILYLVAGAAALGVSFRELPYAGLVAAVVTTRCATFAASCGTWVHTPELFPVEIRGTAHAVCSVSKNLGSLMGPVLVSQFVSPGLCGLTMSTAAVAAGILALQLPETRKLMPELYDPSGYLPLGSRPLANVPETSINSLRETLKV
eukprot:s2878_g1.t3